MLTEGPAVSPEGDTKKLTNMQEIFDPRLKRGFMHHINNGFSPLIGYAELYPGSIAEPAQIDESLAERFEQSFVSLVDHLKDAKSDLARAIEPKREKSENESESKAAKIKNPFDDMGKKEQLGPIDLNEYKAAKELLDETYQKIVAIALGNDGSLKAREELVNRQNILDALTVYANLTLDEPVFGMKLIKEEL